VKRRIFFGFLLPAAAAGLVDVEGRWSVGETQRAVAPSSCGPPLGFQLCLGAAFVGRLGKCAFCVTPEGPAPTPDTDLEEAAVVAAARGVLDPE
jgi:hypothetical protein